MDWLHFIGRSTYGSVATFKTEARRLGVSRRVSAQNLPRFNFGDRVYLFWKEPRGSRLFGYFVVDTAYALFSDEAAVAIAAELGGLAAEPARGRTERECGFFDADFQLAADVPLPQMAAVLRRHGAGNLMVGGAYHDHASVRTPIVFQQGFRTLDYDGLIRGEADRRPRTRLKGQFYAEEAKPSAAPRGGRLIRLALYVQRPTTEFGRTVYEQIRRVSFDATTAERPVEEAPRYVDVPVLFATDRREADARERDKYFGHDRAEEMTYGICHVSIPDRHTVGTVERPSWFTLEFRENPDRHVVVLRLERLAQAEFRATLVESVKRHGRRAILLFVHGYNVTFPEAVRRTAQLAFDLGGSMIPVCFSWPSAGRLFHYAGDRENAEWASEPDLLGLLHALATDSGSDRIHLAAHSLGTLCLCRALIQYRARGWPTDPFDNLVLASPDIDRNIFTGQVLPHVGNSLIARRVTLYASSRDWALTMSSILRSNAVPRAGQGGPRLIVAEGLDSVDASEIDSSIVNHSFFMDAEPLLRDVFGLLVRGLEPSLRGLERANLGDLPYWVLRARSVAVP